MSGKFDSNLPPGVYRSANDLPRNPDGTIDATGILGPKDAPSMEPPRTLRDEFAMAALSEVTRHYANGSQRWSVRAAKIGTRAYAIADAMLRARK